MKPEQPGRSALGEMELCRRAPSSPSPMELDQPPNFGPRRTYAAVDVDAENLPPGHRPPSPCTPPRMQTKSKGKFDLSKVRWLVVFVCGRMLDRWVGWLVGWLAVSGAPNAWPTPGALRCRCSPAAGHQATT